MADLDLAALFSIPLGPEPPTPGAVLRSFHRCPECLSVVATEERARDLTCSLCGVRLAFLGSQRGHRITQTTLECPCDGRCTGAKGPQCDCSCGGANHGSNRVVAVVRDAGPVPTVTPVRAEVAKRIRDEFRTARDMCEARMLARFPEVKAIREHRGYGYSRSYYDAASAVSQFNKAKRRKIHSQRIKALNALWQEG